MDLTGFLDWMLQERRVSSSIFSMKYCFSRLSISCSMPANHPPGGGQCHVKRLIDCLVKMVLSSVVEPEPPFLAGVGAVKKGRLRLQL